MASIDVFDKAIASHEMWKLRLQLAIATGEVDVPVETIGQDNQCAFGEWLYGSTFASMDKASIYYETVRALHAEFHNTVARVVTLAFDGRKEEAREMIDIYGEFTSISAKLARAISAWRAASQ